jgi:hypothetical protein
LELVSADPGAQRLHGVVNRDDVVLSYSSATRKFSIAGNLQVRIQGTLYSFTNPESTAHANTTAGYFWYVDASGALTVSTSPWNLETHAPLGFVFYDATLAEGIPFYELHAAARDPLYHRRLHEVDGTQAVPSSSTFQASGYTLEADTDAGKTLAISGGIVADEDIHVSASAVADGGPYTIFHRTGATGAWTWTKTATFPFLHDGTNIEWNEYTGTTWQRTAITGNDKYVNIWVFVLPSLSASFQMIFVVGQQHFHDEPAALAESLSSIAWGAIPFQEIAPIYRLTYRRAAANASTGKAVLIQVLRLVGSKASLSVGSGAGSPGSPGQGVPVGGTTGQVLTKTSDTDYATAWATPFNPDWIVVDIDTAEIVVDTDNGTVVVSDS